MAETSGGPDVGTASRPTWRRSSRCSASGCVEAAVVDGKVVLRDSVDGAEIRLDVDSWQVFVAGVKAGDFDQLPS